jgi:hypothetical protein
MTRNFFISPVLEVDGICSHVFTEWAHIGSGIFSLIGMTLRKGFHALHGLSLYQPEDE